MGAEGGPQRCRVAFGVAYDGTEFRGFAAQPGQHTVGGAIADALSNVAGEDVRLTCAGRTDAGVHAQAQVVHCDLDASLLTRRYGGGDLAPGTELPALARALARQVEPEVSVWRAVAVAPDFDARRSATARRYRYDLAVGERIDPLGVRTSWWVGPDLDLAAMRLGCDPMLGSHDFAGFCRRPKGAEGPIVRDVVDAGLRASGSLLRFEIEANAFCHQMVRSLVGFLVAIGQGSRRPSDLVARLSSGERLGAPPLAPPAGLCLMAVRYGELETWS